jgi:hypothetical protein
MANYTDPCPENGNTLSAAYPETANSPIVTDIQKVVTAATPMYDIANKLATAAQEYMAINSVANQLLGYDVRWFRAVPQQRSKDVIFQEYTLSNVEDEPLCIKVVVPGGNIPDSAYDFDLMGIEYKVPLEVQIDKKYWESIAGFGTAPQKKDIVYFPLPNKLYEVESSYLFRGFMEQETTWKMNLKKYQPTASRKESDALKDTIDQYTVSVEELFGEAINNDVKKLVDDQQMSQYNSTSKDKYKSFDASLNTINQAISMYGTIVAQSFYDLQSSNSNTAVTYNATDLIDVNSDRSVTAWIMPLSSIQKEYQVSSITPITTIDVSSWYTYDVSIYTEANYTITPVSTTSLSNVKLDDTIVIYRSGAINFYAKVVGISVNPLVYYCIINKFVLNDLNAIKSDWSTQTGYKLLVKSPINVLDGVNDFGYHIFSVNLFANQYIAINYGTTYMNENMYVIKLEEKLNNNEWYGIVVNIGNSWNQYNVNVWKMHETDKNAKLQNIFYETLHLSPEEIPISQFTIKKSIAYLTNIRLYTSTIESEKQSNELLKYFISDGDQIIIADNCDPRMTIPYITKAR